MAKLIIKDINWKNGEITDFTGRNGTMKCAGVELMSYGHRDWVQIAPITSKGNVGRCDISIPVKSLPEVIGQLQGILKSLRDHEKSLKTEKV